MNKMKIEESRGYDDFPRKKTNKLFGTNFYDRIKYCKHPRKLW